MLRPVTFRGDRNEQTNIILSGEEEYFLACTTGCSCYCIPGHI